jgi:hypothetical protein
MAAFRQPLTMALVTATVFQLSATGSGQGVTPHMVPYAWARKLTLGCTCEPGQTSRCRCAGVSLLYLTLQRVQEMINYRACWFMLARAVDSKPAAPCDCMVSAIASGSVCLTLHHHMQVALQSSVQA